MSRSYEVRYEMARAMREAAFRERVSKKTEQFYNRYIRQYEEMCAKGYENYIPAEMNRLKNQLAEIRDLLFSDPAEARNVSMEVGTYIYSMNFLAQTAFEQFERQERMRFEKLRIERQKQKSALEDKYFSMLQEIKDPVVANFAQTKLVELKKNLAKFSEDSLVKEVQDIVAQAEVKAEEWRKATIAANASKSMKANVEALAEQIADEKIENGAAKSEIQRKLAELKEQINLGKVSACEVDKAVSEISVETDNLMITEAERRAAVIAIIRELKSQEFSVNSPTIEGDYVKIIASKPSGKRVSCSIDLRGNLNYTFDRYEGMTCLKDIKKFNVELEKIYSIKLSDERILWSNPDKLSMNAERRPDSGGIYQNG